MLDLASDFSSQSGVRIVVLKRNSQIEVNKKFIRNQH